MLVMDEPLNGLDPLAQRAFSNLLKNLAKKGVAIVVSSHQVADMESLVDNVALLHRGQLLIDGTLDEVRNNLNLEEDSGNKTTNNNVTNNALFVGSTSDLQKLLKQGFLNNSNSDTNNEAV